MRSPPSRSSATRDPGTVPARWRRAAGGAILLVAGSLVGCAGAYVPPSPDAGVPAEDLPFLVSPLTGYPLAASPGEERQLAAGYAELLAGDRAAARATAIALLGVNPGLHPARLLLAQIDYLEGERQDALEALESITAEQPTYAAAQLLAGRVAEQLEAIPEAYGAYRQASAVAEIAARRAAALRPRAIEIVGRRFSEALERGRLDRAASALTLLEHWAPRERATLGAARDLAAAEGDFEAELSAVRSLVALGGADRPLLERQAELEIEVGEAGSGLRILQDLQGEHPDDPELAEKLARAKFRWRLLLLPAESRSPLTLPELSRGDFATILYWLFPSVRYGRAEGGRIANDVFDHPQRDEIVRVVNLGLMRVDPRLHTFEPYEPIERGAALASFLRLLEGRQPRLACLGAAELGLRPAADRVCDLAARCGLIAEPGECLPAAVISGAAAVEMSRLTLERLGIE